MNNKGYNVVELVIVLALFTVAYFVTVGVVSKNFKGDFEEDLYNQKIESIEKQAVIYGKNTKDLFKKSNSVYKTVEELALANVIINNSEGVVVDPRDANKTLNEMKVKITNKDGKITAKILG